MPDKRITNFDLMAPKSNMLLHAVDLDTNRDRKVESDSYIDYILAQVPESSDFHEYPGYAYTSLQANSLLAFENSSQSGYYNCTLAELDKYFFNKHHPVGTIYENYSDSRNPYTIFGVGTWVSLGAGRVTIGVGTGTDINNTSMIVSSGQTGGEYDVTLQDDEIPKHTHPATISPNPHRHELLGDSGGGGGLTTNDGITGDAGDTGLTSLACTVHEQSTGDQAHNNVQPWVAVYRWRRVS